MGGVGLSVVRTDQRADHGHQHCHLNADEPCKVAVDLLIDGIEPLVHLSLYVGETLIHLFETAVHLFETAVNLLETVVDVPEAVLDVLEAVLDVLEAAVDLLKEPVHLILQPKQRATQIGPAHGVCVHSGLKGGQPFFQC